MDILIQDKTNSQWACVSARYMILMSLWIVRVYPYNGKFVNRFSETCYDLAMSGF